LNLKTRRPKVKPETFPISIMYVVQYSNLVFVVLEIKEQSTTIEGFKHTFSGAAVAQQTSKSAPYLGTKPAAECNTNASTVYHYTFTIIVRVLARRSLFCLR
jgi:hypothetical protein